MKFNEFYNDREFFHGSPYMFDKFDINKVGTGDGLSKFGFGLYFADNLPLAEYYAHDLSLGNKKDALNIYNVSIRDLNRFYEWKIKHQKTYMRM